MRRVAKAAILVIATIVGAHNSAWGHTTFLAPNHIFPPPPPAPAPARLVRHRVDRLRRGVADDRHPRARPRIDRHRSRPHGAVLFPRAGGMAARARAVPRSDRHADPAAAKSAASPHT